VTAGQVAPEPIGLARPAVDPSVDGFGRDQTEANLNSLVQASGDLLGRPALQQARQHLAAQFDVLLQSGRSLAAQKMSTFSGHGAIGTALQGVPPQLPADGRASPPKPRGDGSDAQATALQDSDLISLAGREMRLVRHGDIVSRCASDKYQICPRCCTSLRKSPPANRWCHKAESERLSRSSVQDRVKTVYPLTFYPDHAGGGVPGPKDTPCRP